MLSVPVITGVSAAAAPVIIKAIGEAHRCTVLQANGNNNLARQGLGTPSANGEEGKIATQRAGGIEGSFDTKKKSPKWLSKVPSRPVVGDLGSDYKVGGLGNATSSRGNLVDILGKVPDRTAGGSGDYKRASRPTPSRAPGFGNQSYSP